MIDQSTVGFDREARRLKLDTLVRLRWLAVIGQCVAVSVVYLGFGFPLPFTACLVVILASAAINLGFRIRRPASHRLADDPAFVLLAFDLLQLAALLYLTGGLQNPFSILFLAPVLISATALPPSRTVMLGSVAVGLASVLAVIHRPLPWMIDGRLELPFLYVTGIWTSILLGIAFTAAFAYRVAEEARQLAGALAATELVLAREQHLSQLDGLAAAAAHELGTPLATIALVAKELDNQATPGTPMAEDTGLLREQVERCRVILSKLTSLADDEQGGFLGAMSLHQLIEELAAPQRSFGIDIKISCAGAGSEPSVPRLPGLIYGLGNLVENAIDFADAQLLIDAHWSPDTVSIEIRDDGPGFAPEVLLHVGEPYVTTRAQKRQEGETTSGLGLGLFIAKTLIERSGAHLTLDNEPSPRHGAVARIVWPRANFPELARPQGDFTVLDETLTPAETVPI